MSCVFLCVVKAVLSFFLLFILLPLYHGVKRFFVKKKNFVKKKILYFRVNETLLIVDFILYAYAF